MDPFTCELCGSKERPTGACPSCRLIYCADGSACLRERREQAARDIAIDERVSTSEAR
jgi:hypothetical protein